MVGTLFRDRIWLGDVGHRWLGLHVRGRRCARIRIGDRVEMCADELGWLTSFGIIHHRARFPFFIGTNSKTVGVVLRRRIADEFVHPYGDFGLIRRFQKLIDRFVLVHD